MSAESRLCKEIIKEEFGIYASKVTEQLLIKGRLSLHDLIRHTCYTSKCVKEVLTVLIHHGIIYSSEKWRENTVYGIKPHKILMRLRMSRILRVTEEHYGKAGSAVCQLFFLYGRLTINQIKKLAPNDNAKNNNEAAYERAFTKMAIDQFITAVVSSHSRVSFDGQNGEDEPERCTIMTPRDKRALRLTSQVQSDAVFEPERIGMKRKMNGHTLESKRMTVEDDLPYEMISDYAIDRINRTAGVVIKAFLRNGKDKMKRVKEDMSPPSTPTHIANMLPPELLTRGDIVFPHGSNSNKSCAVATAIEGYVRLLVADQVGFLTPIDECGTGYYAVNFKKLRSNMKKRLFEDYVTERYGKDCCRLIRILLDKDKLTDTQLQRISMIPLHDIRRKLEALFIAGIVEIQEIPRLHDKAANHSFHLWYVPLEKCYDSLIHDIYRIITNLQQRKTEELQKRDWLLGKLSRSDVASNIDLLNEIDKAEVGNMNKVIERIEIAKARLDEMIMVLRDF
ncbi:hypothetical protein G6F70_001823 [Rhizopus microsporus]|nr:hypothetical protein G6F71_000892 [Rhizopus microsporus]KAG1202954.1 hypothetical protein G6F70_001823 [Rhizopus microsporus]KAG1212377.1 hypothetical protein G6F69_003769 [Rhizopus microsporus]KAG1235383.1 hypothetical protein G6F67_002818 [Rhizopus microsporus]KAG1267534.1 hypothetical protein G6F68_001865 [Rhizopus microsporus]